MATLQDYIDVFERFTKSKDWYCIEENGFVIRMSFEFAEGLLSFLKDLKDREAVVRCKDCKFCDEDECMIRVGWFPVKPNWFCADGIAKDTDYDPIWD